MHKDRPYQDIIREHSLGELYSVQKRIDKDIYPDRYALVLNEIEKRKANLKPNPLKAHGSKHVSVKVRYKESIGNIFVFAAFASFLLKEQYLGQSPILIIGPIMLFIWGIYYRTATYIEVKNNSLILRRLLGFKRVYDLAELDYVSLEEDKLFLIMYGDKVDSEIRKRDAHPKDWGSLQMQLAELGLVK